VNNPSEKIKQLASFYGLPNRGIRPAELLFAIHTYYAIFMKLLASEIVSFYHKIPSPLEKLIRAPTAQKFRQQMEELEAGSIFRQLNITNFLEGDLFSWYLPVWSDHIEQLIRAMVVRLDEYNLGDKPTIPDHTLLFLTCATEGEGLFYAALLNSIP